MSSPVPDTWSWRPAKAAATPDGCLRDHSANPSPGTTTTLSRPSTKGSFPASDDPPPFPGLKLVRPRRCAAAGADSSLTPPARRREPGSCEEDPEEQSGQPGDTTQVTGSNSYALLTPVALMGALLTPVALMGAALSAVSVSATPTIGWAKIAEGGRGLGDDHAKVMASASVYVRCGRTNPANDRSGRAQTSDLRRTRWRPVSRIGGVPSLWQELRSASGRDHGDLSGTQIVEGWPGLLGVGLIAVPVPCRLPGEIAEVVTRSS